MLSILTTLLSLLKVLFVSRRLTQVSEPFPQRFPVCTWRVTPDFQVAVYSLRKSLRRNFQLPSCSRLQQWQLCQQINRTVPFKTISWFRPPFPICFSLKGNGFKFFTPLHWRHWSQTAFNPQGSERKMTQSSADNEKNHWARVFRGMWRKIKDQWKSKCQSSQGKVVWMPGAG